jgi:LptD protein
MFPNASVRESRGGLFRWGSTPIVVFLTFMLTVSMGTGVSAQSLQQQVAYSARDSMRYDLANQRVYLFGAARVSYEGLELNADRIVLDLKNEETQAFGAPDSTGTMQGVPEFKQDGKTITADSIRYNFRSKKGMIREVRTTEDQLYAIAHKSKRLPNGEVHSKGGMLTTCDRPHPHYHFAVSRMMVIPDDKIVTGPAIMKFGKVPTPLVIPFGLFPNHHNGSAGILVPTYGNSPNLGYFFLNGGYYVPLGEHLDLQLTGDIYSRGSWGLRAVSRYRTRYRYSGSLDISRSTLLNSIREYPDFSKQNNFFVHWTHLMDAKASLNNRFTASVNIGTSQNFTNNFNSSTNDYLKNTFQSNVQWNHAWTGKPYSLSVGLTHSQNTIDKTFAITLPSATFNVQRIFPADLFRSSDHVGRRWSDNIGLTWSSAFNNSINTTEDQLYLGNLPMLTRQMRNGVQHTGAISTSFKSRFFSVNPEVRFTDRMYFTQLRQTYYAGSDTLVVDTVSRFAAPFDWSAGASLTSKLYGMYTFRGGRLKAIRHVLTPNAGLSYSPGNDTRVFGPFGTGGAEGSYNPFQIGYYGPPPATESGLLTLGLVQSVEAKVLDKKKDPEGNAQFKKIKLLDFVGFNTSYDLLKDSLNWNPANVSARTQFVNLIDVNVVSTWDPYSTTASGTRISRTQRALDGRLARLLSTSLAVGVELKSPRYGQSTTAAATNTNAGQVVGEADPSKGAPVDFTIPWHLRVNYSYDLSRDWKETEFTDSQRQSILFNGDFSVLKWWKVGFNSGYDLEAKDFTNTSVNLYWDLHCWEFNFNMIPLGLRKSFTLRINVKASVLKDLKYELVKPFGNDGQLLR